MEQEQCTFMDIEVTQWIQHELCSNPNMLEINNQGSAGKMPCMGHDCGNAVFINSYYNEVMSG